MKWTGNLRKMRTNEASEVGKPVKYFWEGRDVLKEMPSVDVNNWIGKNISWKFHGVVNCVVSGESMSQAYRMGMSKESFFNSPISCPSIINPELSTIHTGVALRNREFEEMYHNVPHVVYISRTDKLKVGVTGFGRESFRWNDQGAVEGLIVCEVPYRQMAGEIEVVLKEYFNDKTYWMGMLKDVRRNPEELLDLKDECFEILGSDYETFFSDDDDVREIHYPGGFSSSKIKTIKLHKSPIGEAKLIGVKGQYLVFEDGRVMNVRAHEGCRLTLETD